MTIKDHSLDAMMMKSAMRRVVVCIWTTFLACADGASQVEGLYRGDCRVVTPPGHTFECHAAAFGGYLPLHGTKFPLRVARDDGDLTACSGQATPHNEYDGAMVLVRRGGCVFQQKLASVAAGEGAGMILINTDNSVLQLGSLEYEPYSQVAVSVKRSEGERLLALIRERPAMSNEVTVIIGTSLLPLDQAWRRMQYLLSINAPLVAYETFLDALPSHARDVDALLATFTDKQTEPDQHDEQQQLLLTFCSHCMDAFNDHWEFSREASLHASIAAATTMTSHGKNRQSVFQTAAMKLLGAGYYPQAATLLTKLMSFNKEDEMVKCFQAFLSFVQGDVAMALKDADCGSDFTKFNVSTTGLSVPHENFLRLAAFHQTTSDSECLQRLLTSDMGSDAVKSSCCRRRLYNRDSSTTDDRSTLSVQRGAYSYQSTFIEELFHTLNIMGVFMDEIGAFHESLRFFRHASRLCADWSLALEFREALAIPIVFDSTREMKSHMHQLDTKIDTLRTLHQQHEDVLSSLTGTHNTVGFFSRPEDASFSQYTMTPPTMFVGYQGHDVLPLQQSIFTLRSELFPSLRSSSLHPLQQQMQLPIQRGGRRRRVAFVSSWFRNHSVGKLILGIIKRLDRTKFHVLVYRAVHFLPYSDEWTKKFRDESDSYMELPSNQEDALALLQAEAIDILVYHELGMDAWLLFLAHHRLAPAQCVFWGHPITTGNPSIDYFISSEYFISDFFEGRTFHKDDADSEPGTYHGSSFSEQVVLFRGLSTFFTNNFNPAHSSRPFQRGMLHLPDSARLYVCPQTLMKLHPEFDRVLHGILTRDSKARIILLSSPTQRVWKEQLRRRFRRSFGENHRRILFFSTLPYQEFMGLLSTADVVLDPFPFGGGVTTLDALAVGTPVVTLPSAQTVMELAAGFLRYMHVTDTIVATVDDYVTMALRIAHDTSYRKDIHDRILKQHHTLYEDEQTLDDWNTFLDSVCITRPSQ